jgi:hypothetical protein
MDSSRPARVVGVHALALAMPHVTRVHGPAGKPLYQVCGKSFVFFRNRARMRPTRRQASGTTT